MSARILLICFCVGAGSVNRCLRLSAKRGLEFNPGRARRAVAATRAETKQKRLGTLRHDCSSLLEGRHLGFSMSLLPSSVLLLSSGDPAVKRSEYRIGGVSLCCLGSFDLDVIVLPLKNTA